MKKDEMLEVARARAEAGTTEAEIRTARDGNTKRKAEFKTAIEASTARILNIALTRGPTDSDPEAA